MPTVAAATGAQSRLSDSRPSPVAVGTIAWLASELMFFAGLIAMYFTIRATAPAEWTQQTPRLDLGSASASTIVLALSSVACWLGARAAERFQPRRTGPLLRPRTWGMQEWMTLTLALGALFAVGQGLQYAALVGKGLTISSSPYGSVLYLIAGIHGLHVICGLIAFPFLLRRSFPAKLFGHREATAAIITSYYWHLVTMVWIALFGVVFLIR